MQVKEYPVNVDNEAVLYAKQVLFYALYIGEKMLISGAEVARVEDSMRRICTREQLQMRLYGYEEIVLSILQVIGKYFFNIRLTSARRNDSSCG